MSKRKSERNARGNARKKARQNTPKAMRSPSTDIGKTNDAKAASAEANKPNVASNKRFKAKRIFAVVTLLCLVATSIFTYWLLKPTREQAKEAKQVNDRNAGRLSPKAEIVALIPALKSAEMKPLAKIMQIGR